jgi:CHASE3 domain sensor protein
MRTYKVLDLFDQTPGQILDAEASQRGYFLAGKEEYLEPYNHAMDSIHKHLAELKKLTASDPMQPAN